MGGRWDKVYKAESLCLNLYKYESVCEDKSPFINTHQMRASHTVWRQASVWCRMGSRVQATCDQMQVNLEPGAVGEAGQ